MGLTAEIRALREELAERESAEDKEEKGYRDQVTHLKKQIADLEIDKSKREEEHAREKREVEHMVGLERKRQEFEAEAAARDATLKVREENLQADRERFEKQMAFTTERFETEVGYLKDMMTKLMTRLPDISARLSIGEPEANGDGAKEKVGG